MAGLTAATEAAMLSQVFNATAPAGTKAAFASLHTADPGTTGVNEATGGSYARQAVVWGAPSSGLTAGGTVNFPVPAGTYTHVGYWTAVTGGTYIGGYPLNGSVTFGAPATLPVTLSESVA